MEQQQFKLICNNNKNGSNESKNPRNRGKSSFINFKEITLQVVVEATGMESKKRATKENPTSRILGLVFKGIFLGISSLRMSTISFGLRFRILGLQDYILDCEGALGGLILCWWLSFLIHLYPLRNIDVRKGGLGKKELLGRRVQLSILSNIL